jgi:8-oxo-dGTP diphosphatase
MKQIDVAVGVVFLERDDQRRFFICKRNAQQHQGDKWEFPGGKVETDETPAQALGRELKEEIDIQLTNPQPLIEIPFEYPDKRVCLHVFLVGEFSGNALGAEGQQCLWVNANDLHKYTFPEANVAILDALREIALIP